MTSSLKEAESIQVSINTESKNKRASGAKIRKESAIKKKIVDQLLTEVPKLSVLFVRLVQARKIQVKMKFLVFPWIALLEKFYPPTTIPDTQELETGHAAHAIFQ
ncbi:hypothetical protein OUZ56_018415 [Daphnia magna]|uniref:Uncharacterized protein n=1 Tax=Daphnia magna TaxID=35525 RepID=A0ABQ9Z8S1_9CRUS|nr:hypothetical protein OUZ56_018415 [Daphnia magna]